MPKFTVSRASAWGEEGSPCENATLVDGKWTIVLDTMDNLLKFIEKNGSIVVEKNDADNALYSITIYDDYIE